MDLITPKILTLRIIRDLHSLSMEVTVQLQTIHVEKNSVEVKLVKIYPSYLHGGGLKIHFVNALLMLNILKVLHFDFWHAQHSKQAFFQGFVSILHRNHDQLLPGLRACTRFRGFRPKNDARGSRKNVFVSFVLVVQVSRKKRA